MLLYNLLGLFLPVFITGCLFLFIKINGRYLRLLLAFSAAYLFALSLMHLLPDLYEPALYEGDNVRWTGLFIILGFFIQIVIEYFSTGIEHGHVHRHSKECHTHLPLGIFIGLYLHSFLEGLPIYQGTHEAHETGLFTLSQQMVFGIALHNIPISIAFVGLLLEHKVAKTKVYVFLFLFAMMAPLGCMVSAMLHNIGLNHFDHYLQGAFALVIGIFLHISTAIMFETGENHRYNFTKLASMLFGVAIAFLLS